MKRLSLISFTAALLTGIPAAAQFSIPEIAFDSAADPLKLPDNIHLGEVAGVATNSKGDVFVYTRTGHPTITIGTARPFAHGGSRLFQFDKSGKFVREIGQDSYGFMVAQQVRVDPQDNIWVVDQMSSMVIKLDPNGRVQLLLGRKAEAERVPALPLNPEPVPSAAPAGRGAGGGPAPAAEGPPPAGRGGRGGPPGAGAQSDLFQRPTDVAWDSAGNIYVADGYGNARVAKFDKHGKFIKSWGSRGLGPGEFNRLKGIALDTQGNVYVADSGNRRIQVFDGDGTFKTQFLNAGTPSAICITPGAHQYLYSSNSNPPDDIDVNGEIYKMELNGKIVGRFGRAGKLPKEFGTVNAIDCRSDNELYVGEIGNWRVQKVGLHTN
ncbi:MAG TPA: peptidyl-alpha-hydroxyglycine alpha-amidating lyase family protein [Bryobacteraceae bacterium]|jgi:DNA-binding beta-propeller fold protein YncE|nr:peptidyl-alpha-hydroxyglycine alpha-amidating lyase family protein [Bryobacteraceae bacterium]